MSTKTVKRAALTSISSPPTNVTGWPTTDGLTTERKMNQRLYDRVMESHKGKNKKKKKKVENTSSSKKKKSGKWWDKLPIDTNKSGCVNGKSWVKSYTVKGHNRRCS